MNSHRSGLRRRTCALSLLLLALTPQAWAQAFPTKPIRLVAPAGTPAAVVAQLHSAFKRASQMAE